MPPAFQFVSLFAPNFLNKEFPMISNFDYADWLMLGLATTFATPAIELMGAGLAAVVGL